MAETHSTRPRWLAALDLDRFDVLVLAVMLALTAGIVGVVLAGDQLGVTIASNGYAPQGSVRGSEPIRIRFSDDMDQDSVAERFRITPDTPGDITWTTSQTLIFTPQQPLLAGQTYTVTVERGARASRRGSSLADDFSWTFSVRLPRVAYLAPADRIAANVMMTDTQSGEVYQLTTVEDGSEDFAVSPNGSAIAFSHVNPDGTSDIWVVDLINNTTRQMTNCVAALCDNPSWKPDGTQIVYQRAEFNAGLGTGLGPSRAWVVDVNSQQTVLLFADSQRLGFDPTWSPDGRRLAVFDASLPGIRVHDFTADSDAIIESMQGVVGRFSPDGSQLVYPVLVRGALGQEFYTHLEIVDFDTVTRTRVSGPEDTPVEDADAVWSPDGQILLIARRYLDERYTPGQQLYLLDLATDIIEPLVVDASYNHSAMSWDASGRRIVFQRFSLSAPGARPEIWTFDLDTGELAQVADNAFLPAWVP
ncbi:MAG: PD40 domain-containing protein [Anaerolineae bacterium]|nr:PD40 domain-containing protein [Anaerolineae bacterium]